MGKICRIFSRSGDRELQGPPHSVAQDRQILHARRQKILCIWDILEILLRLQVRKDLNVYRRSVGTRRKGP